MPYDFSVNPIGIINERFERRTNPFTLSQSVQEIGKHGFVPAFAGIAAQEGGVFITTHANLSHPRIQSEFSEDLMGGSPILGKYADIIA